VTTEVEEAIAEVRAQFPGHKVDISPEDQGGAYVVVHDLDIGKSYQPSTTWVGFLISYLYPQPDVYPHFIDVQVKRVDGNPLGDSFSGPTTWPGREGQVSQVSRRSKPWNPATDTAATKLAKVLDWIRTR
jgi:hypothetical protein